VLAGLGPEVSRRWPAAWGGSGSCEVLDGVAVPVARRCRVRRGGRGHRPLAGTAAFGRGGSDRDWSYGVELLLAVRSNGPISGFLLAPADCGERWLAEALLRWRACPAAPPPTADELAAVLGPTHQRGGKRQGPTGPLRPRAGVGPLARVPYLADLGFAGAAWGRPWLTAWGAVVLTKALFADHPDDRARQQLTHTLGSARQMVETVNGWLEEHLGLHFPRARTDSGLLARLGAKIAAFNIVLWIHRTFGRPLLAACGPFS
jgi:hypothetical protein